MTAPIHGRGASTNPLNRFIPLNYEPTTDDPDGPAPTTQFFEDCSRSIVATNDSPDVGFTHSINPYRGCEHGCVYCYSRPFHEYLGFSAGLDFETKIMVKPDAPDLLRRRLMAKSWRPVAIAMSGVTDCYQPIERRLKITRRCLEVLAEFRNPVGIVTKSRLVTRDIDVLKELAKYRAAAVIIAVTTLDAGLAGVLEPRASRPAARLAAISELAAAGVPVGILVAPVIPGLTDHEIPAILEAGAAAGAKGAGYTMLRLPYAVADLFQAWLQQHYPEKKERVLSRVRQLRGGRLNDPNFGSRMRGEGAWAGIIQDVFNLHKSRLGLNHYRFELSTDHFRRPAATAERSLFDDDPE